jgi:hypothetical protein
MLGYNAIASECLSAPAGCRYAYCSNPSNHLDVEITLASWFPVTTKDISAACRDQLATHVDDGCHIFTDLLNQLEPFLEMPTSQRDALLGALGPDIQQAFINNMQWCARAWCCVHQAWCAIPRFDLIIAGTPCTDYSSSGHRKGLHGPTHRILLAFCHKVMAFAPAIVIHENVPDFPHDLITLLIGACYWIFSFVIMTSDFCGGAVKRRRRYTLCFHRDKVR